MKSHSIRNFRRISKGTSLVEVMVSVLIMSIGLLGIAALQATALRNTHSALERTQAVIHTYSILDAMRANPVPARSNQYDVGTTCAAPGGTSLVNTDLAAWITSMRANVSPDACGSIACAGSVCTITVQWNDSRGTSGITGYSVVTRSRI